MTLVLLHMLMLIKLWHNVVIMLLLKLQIHYTQKETRKHSLPVTVMMNLTLIG